MGHHPTILSFLFLYPMAKHLDLEEQEQLDALKHFWSRYGTLITSVLVVVLGAFAAWNGYQYWQRSQGMQAGALYDQVDRAAAAGDVARVERSFADIREKYPATAYAHQAGLLAAKVENDKGTPEGKAAAKSALTWVAEKSSDTGYQVIARLRLAGLLVDDKAYDEALKQLDGKIPKEFEALVADRKGDILQLQGKKAEAIAAYTTAYEKFGDQGNYRQLVEVKLTALGVNPKAAVVASNPSAAEVK